MNYGTGKSVNIKTCLKSKLSESFLDFRFRSPTMNLENVVRIICRRRNAANSEPTLSILLSQTVQSGPKRRTRPTTRNAHSHSHSSSHYWASVMDPCKYCSASCSRNYSNINFEKQRQCFLTMNMIDCFSGRALKIKLFEMDGGFIAYCKSYIVFFFYKLPNNCCGKNWSQGNGGMNEGIKGWMKELFKRSSSIWINACPYRYTDYRKWNFFFYYWILEITWFSLTNLWWNLLTH